MVSVTDVVDHEGGIGLLMEYVEGFSLEDCLAGGPMALDDALSTFRQVVAGVGAAHAAGVTHRDLKPANILLTTDGNQVVAKVTDFGIAKVLREGEAPTMTRAGVTMGTPGYMAPEQISDSATADHRADIFALGAILYEMIAGVPALRESDVLATMNRTASGTYVPLSQLVPDVPEVVNWAVDGALEPDRRGRIQTCRDLARTLFGDADLVPALGSRLDEELSGKFESVSLSADPRNRAEPTLAPAPDDIDTVDAHRSAPTRVAWTTNSERSGGGAPALAEDSAATFDPQTLEPLVADTPTGEHRAEDRPPWIPWRPTGAGSPAACKTAWPRRSRPRRIFASRQWWWRTA